MRNGVSAMTEPAVDLTFFTAERMTLFWEYVKTLVEVVMPAVMIIAALACVGLLIGIIVSAVFKASGDEEEDFERREY